MDSTACENQSIETAVLELMVQYDSFVREMSRAHGRPEPRPWPSALGRPVPRWQSDSKGTCAQHLVASAPSSPEYAGRSGDGEFAKPGAELAYQKCLATELMTLTSPSDNEQSRMAKYGGPERSKSPQSDTSSSSTLKLRDYHPALLKPDRDPASGLRYSTIQNLPRYREAAYTGFDIDAPVLLDALKTPVPHDCAPAPVRPSGQPKVLRRSRSPPSAAEVSEDNGSMSEPQLPARGPLTSTGRTLSASDLLDRLGRPAPGKGMSKYRGVSWHNNKWRAAITHRGNTDHLGSFCTMEEAAKVYDVAALKLKGPDARTNFPASNYGVVWNPHDARPRERAPAQKRRSPNDSPCDLPGASGGPTSNAHPVQRAAKRRRAKAGAEVRVEAMDVEADFEVLPKAVQKQNRAQRAQRRAAAASGPQVVGSTAALAMVGRPGQLPPIPEVTESEPDRPSQGSPTTSTTPTVPAAGRAPHRSARKKAAPVRSHLY